MGLHNFTTVSRSNINYLGPCLVGFLWTDTRQTYNGKFSLQIPISINVKYKVKPALFLWQAIDSGWPHLVLIKMQHNSEPQLKRGNKKSRIRETKNLSTDADISTNTKKMLWKIYHLSPVTCHLSPVTCQVSHVMCHLSHVTCHMSLQEHHSHRPSHL